jgi:hypothetical protein
MKQADEQRLDPYIERPDRVIEASHNGINNVLFAPHCVQHTNICGLGKFTYQVALIASSTVQTTEQFPPSRPPW